MQQKRKVIQFIELIAKSGMEGMKDEFVQCRNFIPNAITRTAHNQNLKRCRYPGVIYSALLLFEMRECFSVFG